MTREEAKLMLQAKLECLKRETSGTDFDCNNSNCDECSLCYEQGNMGEQKEALYMAIKALEQTTWIPCSKRLPKKEKKTYWVCTDTGYQCECRWVNNRFGLGEGEWSWSIFDTPPYSKPIAWMPLPEPY